MASCPSCTAEVPAGVRWCSFCGIHTRRPEIGRLASPATRLGAFVLDGLVFGMLVFGMLGAGASTGTDARSGIGAFLLSVLFIAYVVWALILFAKRGTTPGKNLLGVRVITTDDRVPGFFTMLVREWVGRWISGFIFGLGYLWILFDKENQGWHDKFMSTYVVVSERGEPSAPIADTETGGGVEPQRTEPAVAPSDSAKQARGDRASKLGVPAVIPIALSMVAAVLAVAYYWWSAGDGVRSSGSASVNDNVATAVSGVAAEGSADADLVQADQADRGDAVGLPLPKAEPPAASADVNLSRARAVEDSLGLGRSVRRRIQAGLTALGFEPGPADGLFGAGTRAAIRDWQEVRGEQATGYLTAAETEQLSRMTNAPRPPVAVEEPSLAGVAAASGGSLAVRTAPGSGIFINGVDGGLTDENGLLVLADVQPGRHVVAARKDGYSAATSVVNIVAGRSEVVELALEQLAGRLTITANVGDAIVAVNGMEQTLPLVGLEVPAGSHRVRVSRAGFRTVEDSVEVRPGGITTLDLVMDPIPVDELLSVARDSFEVGRYREAAEGARSVLATHPDAGGAHLLLGWSLYRLKGFSESVGPFRRAIGLGERVVLEAKHRHGGLLGMRPDFCVGSITLSRSEIAFRSRNDSDHDVSTTPERVTDVEVEDMGAGGTVLRLNTRFEGEDFDFVHRDSVTYEAPPNARTVTIIACRGCDASLNVQEELMRYLTGS